MFENFCARQWQQLWVTSCWNTGFLIETSQQGGDWTESILLTPWMKPLACVRFVFLLYYLLAPVLISISNPPPANASGQGGEVCYVRTNNSQQRQTDCLACYTTPLCVQKCARFVGRCHFGNIRFSDFWSIHVVCFLLFPPFRAFFLFPAAGHVGGAITVVFALHEQAVEYSFSGRESGNGFKQKVPSMDLVCLDSV